MIKLFTLTCLLLLQINTKAKADFWDFFKPTPTVPQQAVEDTHVKSAKCLVKSVQSYSYENYLNKFKTGKTQKSITINKKKFTNQYIQMIDLYRELTGYRTYRLNPSCESVECEIQSLFGESATNKLAKLYREFHFNASNLAHNKGSAFRERELDTIIYSFQQLPKFMFENKTRYLIRDSKNYTGFYANVAGYTEDGTGHITFFNKWLNSSRSTQVYTVIHEYGHLLGAKLGIQQSYMWAMLSNWHNYDTDGENESGAIISSYARGNPEEDFAESFSAYRFNPKLLKTHSPEKYNMLKSIVFLDNEYENNKCSSELIDTNFNDDNMDDSEVLKECNFEIKSYVLGLKPKDPAMKCLSSKVNKLKLKGLKVDNPNYKKDVLKNFEKKAYPWISINLMEHYLQQAEEKLDNIRLK